MTQISKRPLSPGLDNRLQELLLQSLIKVGNSKDASNFLADILTPTEKTMIAKRLAIALLLNRGWDQEAIDDYLKVSLGTIQTVKRNLNSDLGGFRKIISKLEKSREWEQIKLDLGQAFEEIIADRVIGARKILKPRIKNKYKQRQEKYKIL